ncbi:MAG: hypothetical protein ACLPXB_05855 [Thiobacillaceae bacterium]
MVKPNYQFEKRQRDLAKKNKQEEKRRQKRAANTTTDGIDTGESAASSEVAPPFEDTTASVPKESDTKTQG